MMFIHYFPDAEHGKILIIKAVWSGPFSLKITNPPSYCCWMVPQYNNWEC